MNQDRIKKDVLDIVTARIKRTISNVERIELNYTKQTVSVYSGQYCLINNEDCNAVFRAATVNEVKRQINIQFNDFNKKKKP